LHASGDHEVLAEAAESLAMAAHLDTQIAELAAYITQALPEAPSSGPSFAAPRTLQDVFSSQ